MLALEAVYIPKTQAILGEVYGATKVLLDGSKSRFGECNIGNLITDALSNHYYTLYSSTVPVLLLGGAIRTSIQIGNITKSDLDSVLAFPENVIALKVKGSLIKQMLEHSVRRYSNIVGRGEFLQMSGLRVVYDLTKDPGMRVLSVSIICSQCKTPTYEALQLDRIYTVLVTSFVANGGDGYTMLKVRHQMSLGSHCFSCTTCSNIF